MTVYTNAGRTLVQRFTARTGLETPRHGGILQADGLGHFYVLAYRDNHEHIFLYEYQIGTNDPIREFDVTGSFDCMTTDSAGNLYVGLNSDVDVYAPGSTTPERTLHKGLAGPYSMTVDPQGNLYVANSSVNRRKHMGSIVMFAPGASSPSRTITDGVVDPLVIHTDSSGNLGVLNGRIDYPSPNMTMYAPGSSAPLSVITTGIDDPQSFGFDAENNLYVANQGTSESDLGSVTVYAGGSYSLTRTITKNLNHPNSVAVGP